MWYLYLILAVMKYCHSYVTGTPTGKHSHARTAPDTYTPLSDAVRFRIRAAALRPEKKGKPWTFASTSPSIQTAL